MNISKSNWKKWLALAAGIVVVIIGLTIANLLIPDGTKIKSNIVYSDEEKDASFTIEVTADNESGQGSVDGEVIPTVESVDSDTPVVDIMVEDDECDEGEECGLGLTTYDVSSPANFKSATIGRCTDIDGHYGAQCWDLADIFWLSYVGRSFTTCGTGSAKGTIADGCYQRNAGEEFTMIWDAEDLQAGDWIIFNNGVYGHVGMALGNYNNGYITLLGQNQGGETCANGGSAANIINISLEYFAGAFRPNSYIIPETETETETTDDEEVVTYTIAKGDQLGYILRKLDYTGQLWGDGGLCYWIAKRNGLDNMNLIYPGQTITIKKSDLE